MQISQAFVTLAVDACRQSCSEYSSCANSSDSLERGVFCAIEARSIGIERALLCPAVLVRESELISSVFLSATLRAVRTGKEMPCPTATSVGIRRIHCPSTWAHIILQRSDSVATGSLLQSDQSDRVSIVNLARLSLPVMKYARPLTN